MHPSMQRLLQFARETTHETSAPVHDYADVGQRMGRSSAVMTNWKARGISKEGALQAEEVFGCSARWLMTGEGVPRGALSAEAVQRASIWQHLGPAGRTFFDRTLELARLADLQAAEPAARYAIQMPRPRGSRARR